MTPMAGGALALSPLPLSGGRRRSRKLSKKALKALKKMGGQKVEEAVVAANEPAPMAAPVSEGARRRTRKGGRKSRRVSRKGSRGFKLY